MPYKKKDEVEIKEMVTAEAKPVEAAKPKGPVAPICHICQKPLVVYDKDGKVTEKLYMQVRAGKIFCHEHRITTA